MSPHLVIVNVGRRDSTVADTPATTWVDTHSPRPSGWPPLFVPSLMRLFKIIACLILTALGGCVVPQVGDAPGVECLLTADCESGRCVASICVPCEEERCDGTDNDCDGHIDEAFDLHSSNEHCGACGMACENCVAGQCLADAGGLPECVPHPEICNGQDEDCDGNIDEGTLNDCNTCGDVPSETCNELDDDCDGTIDEGTLNACGTCGDPPSEVCNALDDDCDGATDEGVKNACGDCGEVPSEVCDGVDNDCDTVIDEEIPGVDESCVFDQGICSGDGALTCDPDMHALLCTLTGSLDGAEDEICGDALDNDCDGNTDEGFDLESDPLNCGACDQLCEAPNALIACVESQCVIDACEPGFRTVDDQYATGCECAPDDLNCDGIGGDLEHTVFVDVAARQGASGAIDDPVSTIEAALAIAASDDEFHTLLITSGGYELQSSLEIDNTLGLHGGYTYRPNGDPKWVRDGQATTIQVDARVGIRLGPDSQLTLSHLTLATIGAGSTVIGIDAAQASALTLTEVIIEVGRAQDGEPPSAAAPLMSQAQAGSQGHNDGLAGAPGENPDCPRLTQGGEGGTGSPLSNINPVDGVDGSQAVVGAGTGGRGATPNIPSSPGLDGEMGLSGAHGGIPAFVGQFNMADSQWQPALATDPERGRPGGGGGGGGGGRFDNNISGNGGSGGGAGGCGGPAGHNGLTGGSSFGLVLGAQCVATIDGVIFTVGPGGQGSDGTSGLAGGQAGNGGISIGAGLTAGGAGGRGGDGGCGGSGSGGPGGHSIGILYLSASRRLGLFPGGGSSIAAPGDPGASGLACLPGLDPPNSSMGRALFEACCAPPRCAVLDCAE